MMRKITLTLLALTVILSGCTFGQVVEPTSTPAVDEFNQVHPEWQTYFDEYGVEGAFVLYDLNNGITMRFNPERCTEGFLPASTFKVLNALIALETGVIADENTVIPWDGTVYPIESWNQDQTLTTAMANSVVWAYQEMARRIGAETMQSYVDVVGYGNMDIARNPLSFWLDGDLRISADEQVAFLRRLYSGDLPFSERTLEIVRRITIVEETAAYTLHAKAGSTVMPDGTGVGWYIGYLEEGGNVYFFALNLSSPELTGEQMQARSQITRAIFHELGLLP
jgi:beta-lactamase class D